ncbi:hypothetical protein PENTCL1PPCAC_19338, partial [Pristionchus entomophagus]
FAIMSNNPLKDSRNTEEGHASIFRVITVMYLVFLFCVLMAIQFHLAITEQTVKGTGLNWTDTFFDLIFVDDINNNDKDTDKNDARLSNLDAVRIDRLSLRRNEIAVVKRQNSQPI